MRRAAWIAAVGLFEIAIGAGLASSHSKYAIMLVLGVATIWLVWAFPLAGSVVMLFLAAGVVNPEYFVFRAAGRTVYGYELVLLVLFARAMIRPARRTWGGAAGVSLAVFLAVLVISTLLAVHSGSTSLNNAINWGREFDAMAFFWVVVRLFGDRRSLGVLLTAGIVLGALSGAVGLIVALSGNANTIFQDPGNMVASSGGLLRVRMPGLGLGFVLLWLLLTWLTRSRRPRRLWWACLPLIVLDILVSQNRNMWVVGVFSLALMMLIAGPRVRGRLMISLVLLAVALTILVAAPQGSGGGPKELHPIISRASTLLNPNEISQSGSASDRELEDTAGWRVAQDHLAIGIGPGVSYGINTTNGASNGSNITTPRLFLQNQYLYLLLITGVPGILAWMLFLLITLRTAVIRHAPLESRVLGIGVLALMLTAIVMLSFTDSTYLIALALISGAICALRPSSDRGRVAGSPLAMVGVT